MVFLKFVLLTILGVVLGYVITVFAGYPLLVAAEGGRDMNGGIAMGVFFQLGPVGAVVGGILGMLLAASTSRDKKDEPQEKSGKRGTVILGIVIALIFGYFLLLAFLKGPAPISLAKADVEFELRSIAESVSETGDFKVSAVLFDHHNKETVPFAVSRRVEGEYIILTGTYRPEERYHRMQVRVNLSPELTVTTSAPALPGMSLKPGFTDWIKVNFIKNPKTGDSELGYAQEKYMYRFQPVLRDE